MLIMKNCLAKTIQGTSFWGQVFFIGWVIWFVHLCSSNYGSWYFYHGRKMFWKNSCHLHKIKRHGILANVAPKLLTLVIWPKFGFLFFLCLSLPLSPKALCWKISLKKLVQFSRSVVSDALRPHESQHARPPCPSQLPELTQTHVHQVGDAIQPSHPLSFPSPPAPNPFQHQSFPMSHLLAWGGQSIGVSALASVLPMNTQDWSPLGWTSWISFQSRGLSRVFSNTTVQKHQFCIMHQPGLATRFIFDIIHVSRPFSQIIPPSPSPRVQKTVLYISVSFAVSYTGFLLPSF